VIPGLPSWPAPLQALALVASPRLIGLQHKGYGSFLVITLSHYKSAHIRSLPLFFGTTTIGKSQLAFSTRAMKLTLKSLSKSYLTTTT
jgi:hypothetical protein